MHASYIAICLLCAAIVIAKDVFKVLVSCDQKPFMELFPIHPMLLN